MSYHNVSSISFYSVLPKNFRVGDRAENIVIIFFNFSQFATRLWHTLLTVTEIRITAFLNNYVIAFAPV